MILTTGAGKASEKGLINSEKSLDIFINKLLFPLDNTGWLVYYSRTFTKILSTTEIMIKSDVLTIWASREQSLFKMNFKKDADEKKYFYWVVVFCLFQHHFMDSHSSHG